MASRGCKPGTLVHTRQYTRQPSTAPNDPAPKINRAKVERPCNTLSCHGLSMTTGDFPHLS